MGLDDAMTVQVFIAGAFGKSGLFQPNVIDNRDPFPYKQKQFATPASAG
jgi:hypothetical protein